MKKNKFFIIISIVVILLLLTLLIYLKFFKDEKLSVTDIDNTVHIDNSNIDWDTYSSYEVNDSENGLYITEKGIYTLTGEINGQIVINTSGNVKLILDNVTIKSSNGPCILVKEADNVVISTVNGTINTLEDSSNYTNFEEEDGCIFSHDDLILDGSGTLKIIANYQDGIVSKDDLRIDSGTYIISSVDDAIRGKDSVYIVDGDFTINSSGDGIKSSNETETDKGSIVFDSGNFNIVSELDGIQAVNKVIINGGTFDITTGGGSSNVSTSNNWGQWGNNKSNVESISAKGIKAGSNILINSGEFNFNTSDDSIHSNNYVGISNGNIIISSGDDGIHADMSLVIDDGIIDIKKSYEGLEGSSIVINNGNISVIASDDGFNAAGGNDSSSMNRQGANNFKSSSNNHLTINDGEIYVNSTGDGLDANGSIYINGGNIVVDGPTNNGNGALDYDGELKITGGSLLAIGSSGMAQGISSSSTQYGVLINFSSNYQFGTKIIIKDSSGEVILENTSTKSFSSITFSSNKLKNGEKYTVNINGEDYTTFTISSINTTVGNSSGMGRQGNQMMDDNREDMNNQRNGQRPNGGRR